MEHPRGGIAARPREYETATMAWLDGTVQFLMLARDPLYAQLRSEQVDGPASTTISLGGGQEFVVQPTRITVTCEVNVGPAVEATSITWRPRRPRSPISGLSRP
jgi:hypothetical protein